MKTILDYIDLLEARTYTTHHEPNGESYTHVGKHIVVRTHHDEDYGARHTVYADHPLHGRTEAETFESRPHALAYAEHNKSKTPKIKVYSGGEKAITNYEHPPKKSD